VPESVRSIIESIENSVGLLGMEFLIQTLSIFRTFRVSGEQSKLAAYWPVQAFSYFIIIVQRASNTPDQVKIGLAPKVVLPDVKQRAISFKLFVKILILDS
jgi:hypothetical protein